MTSPAKRGSGNDFTDGPSEEPIYEEILDEFQHYSTDNDAGTPASNMIQRGGDSLYAIVCVS